MVCYKAGVFLRSDFTPFLVFMTKKTSKQCVCILSSQYLKITTCFHVHGLSNCTLSGVRCFIPHMVVPTLAGASKREEVFDADLLSFFFTFNLSFLSLSAAVLHSIMPFFSITFSPNSV